MVEDSSCQVQLCCLNLKNGHLIDYANGPCKHLDLVGLNCVVVFLFYITSSRVCLAYVAQCVSALLLLLIGRSSCFKSVIFNVFLSKLWCFVYIISYLYLIFLVYRQMLRRNFWGLSTHTTHCWILNLGESMMLETHLVFHILVVRKHKAAVPKMKKIFMDLVKTCKPTKIYLIILLVRNLLVVAIYSFLHVI